jgi:hypothetical protein
MKIRMNKNRIYNGFKTYELELYSNILKKISEEKKLKGIDNIQLSILSGLSVDDIFSLETSAIKPNFSKILKLMFALNLKFEILPMKSI